MMRLLIVALTGVTLAGCVNDNSLSGDVYSASEAKQIQNVTYGTLVSVRPVQIQGDDNTNVIGAIGGAVLGGFLAILSAAAPAAALRPQPGRWPVA